MDGKLTCLCSLVGKYLYTTVLAGNRQDAIWTCTIMLVANFSVLNCNGTSCDKNAAALVRLLPALLLLVCMARL